VNVPRQLPLDLPAEAARGREDFLVSPSNEAAYGLVDAWPRWPEGGALLIGPAGAGKSHLAAIFAETARAPLIDAGSLGSTAPPELLSAGALAIEDLDRRRLDEPALFHVLNLARETAVPLLLTARTPASSWPIATPDLASRLRAMTAVSIAAPDDALIRALLVKLFVDRQLVVDTSVVETLVRHLDRSFEAVSRAVAALDAEALSRSRRITRAMASQVMADLAAGDTSDT
jgi:chromosomal replication initiation ATPase DnaA